MNRQDAKNETFLNRKGAEAQRKYLSRDICVERMLSHRKQLIF